MAASHSLDPARWQAHFDGLMGRIAGQFGQVEPRRHARDLLAEVMNCGPWPLAPLALAAGTVAAVADGARATRPPPASITTASIMHPRNRAARCRSQRAGQA